MSQSLFPRFHQFAVYQQAPLHAVEQMKKLGYHEWIEDEADLEGEIMGIAFSTHGHMYFNYEFYGDEGMRNTDGRWISRPSELEYLHYDGSSWHSVARRTDSSGNIPRTRDLVQDSFLSHMSVYIQDAEKQVERLRKDYGMEVIQWFETKNHTNQYLIDKKQRFYEFIFDTRLVFGFDLKIIQRIQD